MSKRATPKKAKRDAKPRAKQPRLPGANLPKDRVLDACCEQLRELRDTINEAKQSEDQVKAKALKRMTDTGQDAYKSHGVELFHAHTDKLRVRLIDDDEVDDEVDGAQGDLGDAEAAS